MAVGAPAVGQVPDHHRDVRARRRALQRERNRQRQPATQLAVDFQNSGIVSEIDVSVGQHVTAGQVLAKVQNQSAQDAFNVAKMNLASAQAKLAEAQHPTGATAAQQQASLTSASVAVTSAQNTLAAAPADTGHRRHRAGGNWSPPRRAKLTNDQANAAGLLDAANAQLTADQAQLNADESPGSSYQQKITTDINNQSSACGNNATLCTNDSGTLAADQAALAEKLAGDQSKIVSDQQTVQTDGQQVTTDQTSLTNAQNTQQATTTKDQQAITAAENQLASAQASLASTKAGLVTDPATLTGDEASVASAQQQFDSAQTALNQTTLTAPVAGTVGAINGAVGETATGASSSSSSSSSTSSTGSAGAASSGFISLTNLSSLQVVAGYSETDAVKIKVWPTRDGHLQRPYERHLAGQGHRCRCQFDDGVERHHLQRHRLRRRPADNAEAGHDCQRVGHHAGEGQRARAPEHGDHHVGLERRRAGRRC